MKSLATRPLWLTRLALPAAALLTVIGGGVASASVYHGPSHARGYGAPARPAQARQPAGFSWHSLTLLDGWQTASSKLLVTGKPGWAVRDGVVYLRGAVKQPNPSGNATFGSLPKGARPAHNLYIEIYTNSDTPGILYIGSNGKMEAYDGNAYTFASLAGVSFPTAAVKSHPLSLEHGWESSQSIYNTGNPAYAVSNGVVYLSGSLHSAGSSHLAFTLPKAARPAHVMYISVYTFDGAVGWLEILPTGQVDVDGSDAASYTSLARISFPVARTSWHDFRLEDGWKSGASHYHTGAPAYAVINGVVYLGGAMYQPSPSTGLWTDIPAAARPANVLELEVYTVDGTAGAVAMTDSLGLVSSNPFSDAEEFTSLAGLSYPPSA